MYFKNIVLPLQLKNDIKALRRELKTSDVYGLLTEKNDQIERGKLIIQERDKSMKKLKEVHSKELQ